MNLYTFLGKHTLDNNNNMIYNLFFSIPLSDMKIDDVNLPLNFLPLCSPT